MNPILTTGLFLASCAVASAQLVLPNAVSARSMSGQFVIYGAGQTPPADAPPGLATNLSYIELKPSLLAVSCERIKQALYRELGASMAWSGKIYLALQPVRGADDPVTIISQRFRDGWNYRVELPRIVERRRFVRALVQSLLLEIANRQAGNRPAEIPVWLSEGLTQLLLAAPDMELIPTETRWTADGRAIGPTVFDIRRVNPRKPAQASSSPAQIAGLTRVIWIDPLEEARSTLHGRPLLTLEDLSWPTDEKLAGEAGEVYRRSAQLFVTELLRLKNGRDCLRQMLGELARYYNWQSAFFLAFHPHFARQLDLEKWWALQVTHFSGRDPGQLWTLEESWRRLDAVVRPPAEVRRATNDLPARAEVTLQAIIRQWDQVQQTPALKAKVRDLELMRLRAAPEIVGLMDEYRQVLSNYLRRRDQVGLLLTSTTRDTNTRLKGLERETLKQLDDLDARRLELKPKTDPAPPPKIEGPPPSAS